MAVPTGIRQGELLGLTWADLDTARGALTVRMQLDRHGNRVALKTRQARREIELPDSLVKALREHKAATLFSQPEHFVLSSATDGPMHYRNVVRRELEKAVEKAKLDQEGKLNLRWHDLRHTALWGLIADGIPLSTVARMQAANCLPYKQEVAGLTPHRPMRNPLLEREIAGFLFHGLRGRHVRVPRPS